MVGRTALAGPSALPHRFPMSIAVEDTDRPLVLIVDDDEEVRSALQELLLSVGIDACCFGSTQELLQADLPERPGCLILDVRMPGASGLDLQQHLASNGNTRPIIFLTGHGDIAMTVQAMKAGAVDFLTKPVRDQTLLDAVTAGIEKDISQRTATRLIKQHVDRYARLTPREREVLREVRKGPPQQTNRVRTGYQRGHRQAAPRQRDEKDARSVRWSAHSHLGTATCGTSSGEITLDQRMVTIRAATGQTRAWPFGHASESHRLVQSAYSRDRR